MLARSWRVRFVTGPVAGGSEDRPRLDVLFIVREELLANKRRRASPVPPLRIHGIRRGWKARSALKRA